MMQTAPAPSRGVFHINPAFLPNEAEKGVGLVEAAKNAGVRKFVFSNVGHPSISKMVNHAGKRPVEEAVYESGMVFTVLQPTMFMQNLDMSWMEVTKQKSYSQPYSKLTRGCYVDYRDVAVAAAIAMTGDRLDYGTFEVSAHGMFNRVELASLMSEALGGDHRSRRAVLRCLGKHGAYPGRPVARRPESHVRILRRLRHRWGEFPGFERDHWSRAAHDEGIHKRAFAALTID